MCTWSKRPHSVLFSQTTPACFGSFRFQWHENRKGGKCKLPPASACRRRKRAMDVLMPRCSHFHVDEWQLRAGRVGQVFLQSQNAAGRHSVERAPSRLAALQQEPAMPHRLGLVLPMTAVSPERTWRETAGQVGADLHAGSVERRQCGTLLPFAFCGDPNYANVVL